MVEYRPSKVFVIFNTEAAQREALKTMTCGSIAAAMDKKGVVEDKYLFNGNLLSVDEPVEPTEVRAWRFGW